MKSITKTVIALSLFATVNAEAFEIRTGVMSLSGVDGGYSHTDTEGTETFETFDSTNVLLEIGHYKNTDKEGFGFGWRLGGSYALDTDEWYNGSTAEFGFSIGYSLIRDLDLKGEFGLGLNFLNKHNATLAAYAGIGLDYAIAEHYLVGASVRKFSGFANTHSPAADNYDYAPTAASLYIGYRF